MKEIGVKAVDEDNEIMIITTEGIIIRLVVKDISDLSRITSGVKLMNLGDGISVASIAKIRESENKSEEELIRNLEKELEEEEKNSNDAIE